MEQMYNVSSNPHIRDKMTTSRIMQLVVIALLPTTLFGIWNFGVHDTPSSKRIARLPPTLPA